MLLKKILELSKIGIKLEFVPRPTFTIQCRATDTESRNGTPAMEIEIPYEMIEVSYVMDGLAEQMVCKVIDQMVVQLMEMRKMVLLARGTTYMEDDVMKPGIKIGERYYKPTI